MQINWYGKVPSAAEFIGVGQWTPLQLLADQHVQQQHERPIGAWYAQASQTADQWQIAVVAESQDQFGRRFPFCASVDIHLPDESCLAVPELCVQLASLLSERINAQASDSQDLKLDIPLLVRRSMLAFEEASFDDLGPDQLSLQDLIFRFAALARAVELGDQLIAVPHIRSVCSAQLCLWLGMRMRHGQKPAFMSWRNFDGYSAHDLAWSWQPPGDQQLQLLRAVPAGPAAMQVSNPQQWHVSAFAHAGMIPDFLQTFIHHYEKVQALSLVTV